MKPLGNHVNDPACPHTGAATCWDAEIEHRGAEVAAGTADTMTLEEYRAHIRERRAARAGG